MQGHMVPRTDSPSSPFRFFVGFFLCCCSPSNKSFEEETSNQYMGKPSLYLLPPTVGTTEDVGLIYSWHALTLDQKDERMLRFGHGNDVGTGKKYCNQS